MRWLGSPCRSWGCSKASAASSPTYIVTPITDRLLTITASAPSADQAVLRANAVASAFLKFRAAELQDQQNLVLQSIEQQVNQAKQRSTRSTRRSASFRPSFRAAVATRKLQAGANQCDRHAGHRSASRLQQPDDPCRPLTAALKGSQILSVSPLPDSRLKPRLVTLPSDL